MRTDEYTWTVPHGKAVRLIPGVQERKEHDRGGRLESNPRAQLRHKTFPEWAGSDAEVPDAKARSGNKRQSRIGSLTPSVQFVSFGPAWACPSGAIWQR